MKGILKKKNKRVINQQHVMDSPTTQIGLFALIFVNLIQLALKVVGRCKKSQCNADGLNIEMADEEANHTNTHNTPQQISIHVHEESSSSHDSISSNGSSSGSE